MKKGFAMLLLAFWAFSLFAESLGFKDFSAYFDILLQNNSAKGVACMVESESFRISGNSDYNKPIVLGSASVLLVDEMANTLEDSGKKFRNKKLIDLCGYFAALCGENLTFNDLLSGKISANPEIAKSFSKDGDLDFLFSYARQMQNAPIEKSAVLSENKLSATLAYCAMCYAKYKSFANYRQKFCLMQKELLGKKYPSIKAEDNAPLMDFVFSFSLNAKDLCFLIDGFLKSEQKDFGKDFSVDGVKCKAFSYSRGNSAFVLAVFNNAALAVYIENAKNGDSAKLCYKALQYFAKNCPKN